jgi:hypothetical protein
MPVPLTNQRTHVCCFEVEEHVKHEKAVDCQVNARDGVVLQVCLHDDVPCKARKQTLTAPQVS